LKEQEAPPVYSAALLEAQQLLLALRERQRPNGSGTDDRTTAGQTGRLAHLARKEKNHSHQDRHSTKVSQESPLAYPQLPDHLGWGSAGLTAVLRRAAHSKYQQVERGPAQSPKWIDSMQRETSLNPRSEEVGSPAIGNEPRIVNLQPAIAMGMLRNKLAASGRVWLLLRASDDKGRGWIEVAKARQLMCERQSDTKVCGWRQLRNLIAQGQGIFWERRDDRLWLRSVPKVAQALGINRFPGRPVEVPLAMLTQGMGQVRAHLFASFHSGRKQSMPIARATLAAISQVSPRTQRDYDRRAQVKRQRNFAIGPPIDSEQAQDIAWQQGQASFAWRDHNGNHGQRDQTYLAWQLPNSYTGPHQQRPFGRQKQFNRKLADLFTKGKTGNNHSALEMKPQCFFNAAKSAAVAQERSGSAVYWHGSRSGTWYFMAQPEE
jgi:hypothetical protein